MPTQEQDPFTLPDIDAVLLHFLDKEAEFGLVYADAGCVIRYRNATALRYLDDPEGTPVGRKCCALFTTDRSCPDCPAGMAGGGSPLPWEIGSDTGRILRLHPHRTLARGGGFFLVIRDVTADRRTERQLREEAAVARRCRERLEKIIRAVGEGLIVADRQGRIQLLNRSAEKFLGISQTTLLNLSLDECIRDRKLLKQLLRAIEQGGGGHFEVEGDAGAVWSVHVASLPAAAESPGDTVFLLRDITRERELDRLKSEFISTAAHELRTPLTAISGFSELILTEEETPDFIREYATYINRKAESLERIISDLLDTSRIEAGRGIDLHREECDITAVVRETVLPYCCRNLRHDLQIDVPPGPLELRIDRGKMVQVLENLLSNAIKYSPQGGGIKVSLRLIPGACQITVEDQGIGMTREEAGRAFERFWRGDSSNTAVGGTGLGLSIAKYIIEAHGGRIWLESRKHRGTTVFFNLPLPPARDGRSPDPAFCASTVNAPAAAPPPAAELFSRLEPPPSQGLAERTAS